MTSLAVVEKGARNWRLQVFGSVCSSVDGGDEVGARRLFARLLKDHAQHLGELAMRQELLASLRAADLPKVALPDDDRIGAQIDEALSRAGQPPMSDDDWADVDVRGNVEDPSAHWEALAVRVVLRSGDWFWFRVELDADLRGENSYVQVSYVLVHAVVSGREVPVEKGGL